MDIQIKDASENSLILYLNEVPTAQSISQLKAVVQQIKLALGDALIDAIASYQSVLIVFDVDQLSHQDVRHKLLAAMNEWQAHAPVHTSSKIVRLPVYYDESVGPDLTRIAEHHQTSIEDVVTKHCMNIYHIYAIGFAPGFAYLGHVEDDIAMPRHNKPRSFVAKGSVAIADHQTAIYPQATPGGWNIIGRCPNELFDPTGASPLPFDVGDRVQFMPISKDEFLYLGGNLDDLQS
jgi:KipI family sensor histidine kinase inhibitor